MIVADTGAILALVVRSDQHHQALKAAFQARPDDWALPWAILPEVDYLLASRVGADARRAWLADLADGAWQVEWGHARDLARAQEIDAQYRALRLGLVDCAVIAAAERLNASAIATTDLRHFGAVSIRGAPRPLGATAEGSEPTAFSGCRARRSPSR